MTTPADEWVRAARSLGARLWDDDVIHDPALRAAIEATPRHVFVPRFFVQTPEGDWMRGDQTTPGYLDEVYADRPLVTALGELADGQRIVMSSSTKPGLMARMIEALRLDDDSRVLEIGTGTGYNAALLSRLLGAERVFSVDIETELVDLARLRLASLGLAPTLLAADGAEGLPGHAPYDRIIATCSVRRVPWAWAEQTRPGGLVLTDLKAALHAGSLVCLRRRHDRLEGRFLPRWAAFMALRGAACDAGRPEPPPRAAGVQGMTALDSEPASELVPWFLAQAELPCIVSIGLRGRAAGGGPRWSTVAAADGSWCEVAVRADDTGRRVVRQGGPVQIWDRLERAVREWEDLDRPDWGRLGLTVRPDGLHTVWLDEPDGPRRWVLPPSR
ncbi:protein-L-isoaspartate O-methyltransferase [Actinoalloteichus hoggarensis]|uniref:Protein-L-isoaspartate O-methyltransferase n=1 Tax=Actinoalloteichus hoggarensis TaxID=1470176 RepID=A0A221W9R6_9PSEU|nr:methyltransferase domain-containing protein [Actinoalloteichus hoggarensis]ASO22750.1 Protein-L-isoaspartate O-methyltransferase [Actinoalloteichus hoggarensis]MBB5924108.1 protein-L-isoaspartate O-methyltransferase [Actinoalloteichus hoggarensis]